LVLRLISDWNRVQSALKEGGKCADVRWYVTIYHLAVISKEEWKVEKYKVVGG